MTIYIHMQKYTYLKKKVQNEHSSIRIKIAMFYYFNNFIVFYSMGFYNFYE